jgi:hypothetical protein
MTAGTYTVTRKGNEFLVTLLECKSDVGSGYALVQALRQYQLHYYGAGARWASSSLYRYAGCYAFL